MTDPKITREAGQWLYRLEDTPSTKQEAEFAAWLARSPEHVQEYLFMVATSRELAGLDPERRIDVGKLMSERASNIVPLRKEEDIAKSPARSRRRWIGGLAAAVMLATLSAWLLRTQTGPTYRTDLGEQRVVKLADGSVVQLNTRSRLEVHFTPHERTVRLLEGEALFTVAHHSNSPFRVLTDTATIQALGTQFDVYRHGSGTTVSVVEGLVQVSSGSPGRPVPVAVAAGEQAQVQGSGPVVKRAAPDVSRAVAWRQRRLDFRGATLAEIAEQFNRYNRVQIRIDDAAIGKRELDGVFDADEPTALLDYLAQDKDLRFERLGDDLIVVRSRRSPAER